MSFRAKMTLVGSIVFSTSIIGWVHIMHKFERDNVKVGVKQDLERQQKKKEKMAYMKEQEELAEAYREAERKDKLPQSSW